MSATHCRNLSYQEYPDARAELLCRWMAKRRTSPRWMDFGWFWWVWWTTEIEFHPLFHCAYGSWGFSRSLIRRNVWFAAQKTAKMIADGFSCFCRPQQCFRFFWILSHVQRFLQTTMPWILRWVLSHLTSNFTARLQPSRQNQEKRRRRLRVDSWFSWPMSTWLDSWACWGLQRIFPPWLTIFIYVLHPKISKMTICQLPHRCTTANCSMKMAWTKLFVSEGLKLESETRMKRQVLVPAERVLSITCRSLIVCGWWRIEIVDTEETKILPLSHRRRWFAIRS